MTSFSFVERPWTFQVPIFFNLFLSLGRLRLFGRFRGLFLEVLTLLSFHKYRGVGPMPQPPTWRTGALILECPSPRQTVFTTTFEICLPSCFIFPIKQGLPPTPLLSLCRCGLHPYPWIRGPYRVLSAGPAEPRFFFRGVTPRTLLFPYLLRDKAPGLGRA